MQYHLNGFRPGDPHVAPAAHETQSDLPTETDVLIVGCGPAGLTLAAQMAAFAQVTTTIIDQKPGPLEIGQADGIACRSVEMFEAFGFAEKVLREAYWVNETTFWKPDPTDNTRIARSDRIQDTADDLSEFPHVILSQARVHDFYLDIMRNSPHRSHPFYRTQVTGLTVSPHKTHPVRVDLDHNGTPRTMHARVVVGCDGARSTVRRSLGLELAGDAANKAWGVMDVLVETDFPDIRLKSVIQSAADGAVLIIPREGGYMVRLYIELDSLDPSERVRDRDIDSTHLIAAARRIMAPYSLDVKQVAWWSVYEIGQRLCNRFDNATDDTIPSVFIAGDAGHTHSPKAGQGMNVSMADAFNLGWKLGAVLTGAADPEMLRSYSAERQTVAQDLIDFDRNFAAMFSARGDATADPAQFQRYFQQHGHFTAGTSVHYPPSTLIGSDTHQHLATGQIIGKRFHSAPVTRIADARPMQLGHAIKADGRWRLMLFAPTDPAPLGPLCAWLQSDPASPVRRMARASDDIDAHIDVRAIYQQPHRDIDVTSLPPLLRPRKGRYGLTDHEKAFSIDPAADIYALRGIDRAAGCMVVVRPDQFVAHVLPLDATSDLSEFFDGFMRPLPE